MTFVTGGLAIAGLAAVAIPILIHLLSRRRRKPVEWAAMRFLLEAFRKHRRRLRLEQLLLLVVRCLILALLGVALARPILEGTGLLGTGGSRVVFLLLDNGMASGLVLDDGRTALRHHLDQAAGLVKGLEASDQVGLVTAARPAKAMLVPPSGNHRAVLDMLDSIEPAESPTDLAGAMTLLRAALDNLGDEREHALVYLLSGFRLGSAALDAPLPPVLRGVEDRVTLLAAPPALGPVANAQVVSVEPLRSLILTGATDGSGQVTVRLARHGGDLIRDVTQVRLAGEDISLIEPKLIQWTPGQSRAAVDFMVDFAVHGDRQVGLTALIDDDRLAADNQRHAVLDLRSRVRVVLIEPRSFGLEPAADRLSSGQWLRRALEPVAGGAMEVVVVPPASLDAADLRLADVAIVARPDLLNEAGWSILRRFVDTGGLMLVVPPAELNIHQWTSRLVEALDLPWRIELEVVEHPGGLALADEQPAAVWLRMISSELKDLVRPVVAYRVLPVDPQTARTGQVLLFADGSPMVIAGSPRTPPGADGGPDPAPARGLVIYLAVAPQLSWTNLPSQPLMVPLVHELVRQGLGLIRSAQHAAVGQRPVLGLSPAAAQLVGPHARPLPLDAAGRPQQPFDRAGLYGVEDRASQRLGVVAVNVDPAAGRVDPQTQAEVVEWLRKSGSWEVFDADDPGAALRTVQSGSPVSGLLLAAVLGLLLVETLLARWFSHAVQGGAGAAGARGGVGGLLPTRKESPPRERERYAT